MARCYIAGALLWRLRVRLMSTVLVPRNISEHVMAMDLRYDNSCSTCCKKAYRHDIPGMYVWYLFFFFRRPQIIVTAHYACTDVLSSCTLVHNTGWFKLHDGKLFPGQSPRRCFESDRTIMHTFSISPYEDLTLRGGVLHDLSSVEIILGNFGPPWTN